MELTKTNNNIYCARRSDDGSGKGKAASGRERGTVNSEFNGTTKKSEWEHELNRKIFNINICS